MNGMTETDHKTYEIYCSMTGQGARFESAEGAAAAFHAARAEDRPCVIYGDDRAARVLVRTLIIGDRIVKGLPGESKPWFHAAYMALVAANPTS